MAKKEGERKEKVGVFGSLKVPKFIVLLDEIVREAEAELRVEAAAIELSCGSKKGSESLLSANREKVFNKSPPPDEKIEHRTPRVPRPGGAAQECVHTPSNNSTDEFKAVSILSDDDTEEAHR